MFWAFLIVLLWLIKHNISGSGSSSVFKKIWVHEVELMYPGIEANNLMNPPEQVSWFYLLTEAEAPTETPCFMNHNDTMEKFQNVSVQCS
jgi:hypothetical protein